MSPKFPDLIALASIATSVNSNELVCAGPPAVSNELDWENDVIVPTIGRLRSSNCRLVPVPFQEIKPEGAEIKYVNDTLLVAMDSDALPSKGDTPKGPPLNVLNRLRNDALASKLLVTIFDKVNDLIR